jgi:hypothetical protein
MDSYFDAMAEGVIFPHTDALDPADVLGAAQVSDDCHDICLDPMMAFPYELVECGCVDDDFEDGMDGDFDSAMTSAGFGTDEDYGG